MTPLPAWIPAAIAAIMVAVTIWAFVVDYRDRHPKHPKHEP